MITYTNKQNSADYIYNIYIWVKWKEGISLRKKEDMGGFGGKDTVEVGKSKENVGSDVIRF